MVGETGKAREGRGLEGEEGGEVFKQEEGTDCVGVEGGVEGGLGELGG